MFGGFSVDAHDQGSVVIEERTSFDFPGIGDAMQEIHGIGGGDGDKRHFSLQKRKSHPKVAS